MNKTNIILENAPSIKEGAVFIADAHFIDSINNQPQNPANLALLNNQHNDNKQKDIYWREYGANANMLCVLKTLRENPPPQVFLMGDMAHLLIGHIASSQKNNQHFISQINLLSEVCEVFYFEGNHDFALDSRIFPRVKIYPRILQPALFSFNNKWVLLSHGDCFIDRLYEYYIKTMNSPMILSLLKYVDWLSVGRIYDMVAKRINNKPIRIFNPSNEEFSAFASKRFSAYTEYANKLGIDRIEYVIEGHFHIGKYTQNFCALPSFYCSKSLFVIQSHKILEKQNG